jgi:hypothetical protein
MPLLQNVDIGTLLLITVGCVLLCVVGLVLMFGLQLIGTTLHTFVGLFQVFESVLSGGPVAWCGCLVLLFICAVIVGGALVIVTCNSDPNAMNFCTLIPR